MDPRGEHAPEAYDALRQLEADVRAAVPAEILEPARHRVAMALGQEPYALPSPPDPVLSLTEQFVIDVTGVDLGPAAATLGARIGPFVQGLWVLDMGLRTDIALGRLFGIEIPVRAPVAAGTWDVDFDEFLKAVARLRVLDWTTTEIVRLRGARFHNCRLCKSLRTVSALKEGADEELFDKIDLYESSDLGERHKVALRLTDAIVTQPRFLDDELVAQVRATFTDAEVVELVLDVMRNAANKVAVAFGADEAHVTEGVELYDVLPDGDVVYDL